MGDLVTDLRNLRHPASREPGPCSEQVRLRAADYIEFQSGEIERLTTALRNAEEALTDDVDIQEFESVKLAQIVIEAALVGEPEGGDVITLPKNTD